MGFLRRLKPSKALRRFATPLVKAGLGVITAGISDKVLSVAKTIGKATRGTVRNPLTAKKLEKEIHAARDAAPPSKRPPVSSVKSDMKKPSGVHPKPKAKPVKKSNGKKRQAPKGGKDFKALSVAWRKAGKPGTWLAWVKSH